MIELSGNLFKITKKQIHVWFINLDITEEKIIHLNHFLSEDEILKASKFRFKKDKNCSIISRGALRLLSGKYLNTNPKTIKFKYGEFGKPYYDMPTELKFNVSHSGNMAAIAFILNCEIGIDIEKLKYDFEVMDIVDNYFSESEIESLKKLPVQDRSKGFYRCWTRKESFIKAKSKGLSFPLDAFSVSINSDEEAEISETKWDKKEKDLWNLFSFTPQKEYIGAVSVRGNIENIKYLNLNKLL